MILYVVFTWREIDPAYVLPYSTFTLSYNSRSIWRLLDTDEENIKYYFGWFLFSIFSLFLNSLTSNIMHFTYFGKKLKRLYTASFYCL